jgi:hypothetical protein
MFVGLFGLLFGFVAFMVLLNYVAEFLSITMSMMDREFQRRHFMSLQEQWQREEAFNELRRMRQGSECRNYCDIDHKPY